MKFDFSYRFNIYVLCFTIHVLHISVLVLFDSRLCDNVFIFTICAKLYSANLFCKKKYLFQ